MPIAVLSIDIIARLARLEADMSKAAHIAEKNAKRMDQAFATVARSIAAIGASLSVGAFALMIKSVSDAGDQLAKLSTKTGVAVEELSKLQYAASLSDLSNEDLGASLIKLNRVMGDAANGSKEAAAALARFGISANSGLSAADAFKQIADKVKATGDETKVASALTDVFGKSFANLIPILKGGSDGLKETGDELERMGGVMSGDLASASEKFNDNMTKVQKSLDSLKITIGNDVIPWITKLSDEFLSAQKAGLTFGEAMFNIGLSNPFKSTQEQIVSITNDIDELRKKMSGEGLSKKRIAEFGLPDHSVEIAKLEKLREYYKTLNNLSVGNISDSWMRPKLSEGIADTPSPTKTGGGSGAKSRAEAVKELTVSTKDYQAAMDSLNSALLSAKSSTLGLDQAQETLQKLMASPEWETYSETMKWSAIEQASFASGALSAADAQSRLNALMADTPTAQLEAATKDAELLEQALSKAANATDYKKIKEALEGVYSSAAKGTEEIEKQKGVAEELGLTFSSALEDAIVKGEEFSDVLEGLYQDILRILVRKNITEPLTNAVSGSGITDFLSGLFTQNANGGVYSSPSLSAYSGGVYSSPQLFKFANGAGVFGEAGPEAIMPLKRGPDGKLGVSGAGSNVVVNVSNNASGAQASATSRQGAGGETIIDVVVNAVKSAIASDIGMGGSVAGAMESQYGLNRAAGAWR